MQKELLLTDLDSMPFRQAQMRTNRRVSYKKKLVFKELIFFSQHIFDAATTQGPWKQAPSTTVINNSGSYHGQEQQTFPSIPMNGSRQKPMVR
jgi:hypothetical protein